MSQGKALTSVWRLQEALDRGSVETARAILQHAVSVFPGKKSLYKALAQLERQHGTPEAVAEVLERGVKYCPQVTQRGSYDWRPRQRIPCEDMLLPAGCLVI